MSKIKLWVDLAWLLVEQYKFNNKITPDKEELQRWVRTRWKFSKDMLKDSVTRLHRSTSSPPPPTPPPLCKWRACYHLFDDIALTYYDHLFSHASASFAKFVHLGERSKDGLKIDKLKDYQVLFEHAPISNGGSSKRSFLNYKKVFPLILHSFYSS